jgi:RNA polymerase sigma factor (sigma-70 family)
MTRRDPPDVPPPLSEQLYSVRVDDAELVRLAATGDRSAWGPIYDRYADRLHDYCWSILRDRHEAEDVLHDAFVTAATKLHQLSDPSSLRPWLYSICRTHALAPTRRRSRELPTDELPEMTAPADVDESDIEYLRRLVWEAAGGLAPRDRSVPDLHLRQGLQGQQLAEALGVKEHHATVLLSRVREHVERSLGALLVARTGRQDCAELDELLSGWDGSLSPLLRKRAARHIDNCDICGERRRRMVSPAALLAGVPILPAPVYLRDRVLEDVALASATVRMASTSAHACSTGFRW